MTQDKKDDEPTPKWEVIWKTFALSLLAIYSLPTHPTAQVTNIRGETAETELGAIFGAAKP